MKTRILFTAILALNSWAVQGATIAMNASDTTIGTTSFNTGLHWTGGAAPTSGNAYQTAANMLRTPPNATSVTFLGDSLEIQPGGEMRMKTAATVTITDLILDGTAIVDLTAPAGGNAGALAGNILLNGNVTLRSGIQAAENLNVLTVTAPVVGPGGFTTAGSFGTIILSGTNTYTGGTTINGGIVFVNGVIANSAVTVASGTFGGNGLIKGAVTIQPGGILQPGQGGTDLATLIVSNNLSLAGTTVINLNRGGSPSASRVSGINTLAEGGTLTVNNAGAAPQLGDTFVLFNAATYSGAFTTLNLPVLDSGLGWSNSLAVNGKLTVVAAPPNGAGVWTNNANGNWSAAANWLNGLVANGADSNANFSAIDITADRTVTLDSSRNIGGLLFGDTAGSQNWFLNASGGSVLTLAVSAGSPTIAVNNSAATINLLLAGTAGLTKSGAGTLVLNGNNSYTGATVVGSGTLAVSGVAGGGAAAPLTVGNTAGTPAVLKILPGANFTSYNLTIGGNASAPGAVFQSGGSLTQIQGANIADFRLGGAANAYGYYHLSGGTLTVNEVGVGSDQTGSIGVMDLSGGNYVSSGYVTLARGIDSLGALNVSGGTMTLSGTAPNSTIGLMWNGSGSSFGVLNIFSGGAVIGPNNATYLLNYNPFSSGSTLQSGVVNLGRGGTLQIGGVMNSAPAIGTSLFNFNGGTLKATVANPNFFANSISGAYVYPGGAMVDDNGGAITISEPLLAPGGYGVSAIELASSGSNYLGAPFVLISGGSGIGATAIAEVDFSSGQITNLLITSPGSGYASSDVLTVTLKGGGGSGAAPGVVTLIPNISGDLIKSGAGTLTLSAANTFAGKTIVSNGTLRLTGSLAGGAVIASGGTMTGAGSISGGVTNQTGGILQPGLGGTDTSTLSISNTLVLAGTTVLTVNRTNAQTASTITGISTLMQGGTLLVTNAGPALQADDSFKLFNAAAYTGAFSVTSLPPLGPGLAWNNDLSGSGTITVISTAPPTNAVVTNLPASLIFATSATLSGQVLATGGQVPVITIFYGQADGGTNAAAWANQIVLGTRSATFNALASGLNTNTTYYFTAAASNSVGVSWASPSGSFTTLAANPSATRVSMLTYHNDNTRQGQNTNETLLTLANVNTNSFGKLFSYDVDGYVYTQPLIMTNLTIPGQGTHNVVFVATEHDTVYAFDADSNAGANGGLLWQVNLGTYALNSLSPYGRRYTGINNPFTDITPAVGITGTPVIDPVTGTLYVNAFTREVTGNVTNYVHRLHALDVTTGNERPYSPVVVAGSVPGTGVDSVGGVMTFNPVQNNQRAALTLAGGNVYVVYAGYADTDPYHGWVFGYNATNFSLTTNYIFNTTPNATVAAFGSHAAEGGIWQGGAGLCVDGSTNLYFMTGNGSFSQNTNGGDYADSFVKLATSNRLAVADYFTPYNQAALAAADTDLGSCGPLLLPDSVGSAAHPHLLVGSGKSGTIYLLDRDNMGHYQAGSDNQIVQSVIGKISSIWSPPAYFNHLLFFQASSSVLRSFSISNGALSTVPVASAGASFGQFNGGPVVSANGNQDAIVWVLNSAAFNGGAAVLYAYNATNLTTLYNSSLNLARDNPGNAIKMTTPTVAGGKVYVGAQYKLSVFGVQVFLDTPIISPHGGAFTNQVVITMTDASPGAAIYYTLDGTAPSADSFLYTGPFILTSNAVVQAVAIQAGAVNSGIASASFINNAAAGTGTGLRGEYFANRTSASPFAGSPVLVQTNATIDFNWGATGPDPLVGSTNFTVRWTGAVQPQFSETYEFVTTADDGGRLFVNGQLLIDDWTDKTTATSRTNSITLAAQQFYNLELDYFQKTNSSSVALSWRSPSTPFGIVPQTQLYSFTNPPPTVVLMNPANGASYTAAASVTIAADADAPNNPVAAVSFYANSTWLGSVSNPPYTITATGLNAGSYALTAVATDGSGLSRTSAPVNITVAAGGGLPYGLANRPVTPAYFNLPATAAGSMPLLLSQTGVFTNTPAMTPVNSLIPYQPNTPLWSDGALKTRFMAVPFSGGNLTADQQIGFAPDGEWSFPAGTVFVKTFELNTDATNPSVKRRLETRLLVRDANAQVYGVTYKWRADNSDADLLASSLSEDILITNATGLSTQKWYYPSPSDCLACHTPAANYVLGLKTRQLNGDETYPATGNTDNQLRALNRIGLFNPAFDEAAITNFSKLSAITNLSASLQERARSYLDANCAQCHRPGGTGITFDARYDTPFGGQNISNYPAALSLGYDNACIVKAKDIWRSMIHRRMNTVDPAIKMPPLARNLIDTNAVQVMTDWINSLPGTPALAPPVITPDGGMFFSSVNVTLQAPDSSAAIYYTLDGSLPTMNSFLYSGAFNLTSNATVSASAFANGFNNSVAPSALFFVQPVTFTGASFTNNVFVLNFAGATGSNYLLQASTNLVQWTPLATNLAATNLFNWIDPQATNFPMRFYRVLQQ